MRYIGCLICGPPESNGRLTALLSTEFVRWRLRFYCPADVGPGAKLLIELVTTGPVARPGSSLELSFTLLSIEELA